MKILFVILRVVPFVGGIVQSIESLFGKGNGTTKKQAAMTVVTQLLAAAGAVDPAVGVAGTALESALSGLIDAVVAFYNAAGVFEHAFTGKK